MARNATRPGKPATLRLFATDGAYTIRAVAVQPAIAPLEAVPFDSSHEPDAYEAGADAISGILATTEVELAAMLARADKARAGVSAEVRLRVRERTASDRLRLGALRHELVRQRDTITGGFDSLLGLLDEADRRLACNDETASEIDEELARPGPAVAFAVQAASSAARDASRGGEKGTVAPPAPPAKRRWWHRWVRPAA